MNDSEFRHALIRELREVNRTLGDLLKEFRAYQADDEERCPKCGSAALEETNAFGRPRTTCTSCGVSFEVANA